MQKKFIVSKSGQEIGPLTEDEIREMLAANQLMPVDYLFDEEKNDWVILNERIELKPKALPATLVVKPVIVPIVKATEDGPPPVTVRMTLPLPTPALPAPKPASPLVLLPQSESATAEHRVEPPPPSIAPTATEKIEKISFIGGVGTVSIKQLKAGQIAIKLQDCSEPTVKLPGEAIFQIAAGPATEITMIAPETVRAGDEFSIQLQVQDQFGNPTHQFNGLIELEISGQSSQKFNATFDQGRSEVIARWTKAETLKLQINNSALKAPAPFHTKILASAPVRLVVESPDKAVAGDQVPVVVKAVDEFGNLATDFKGEISLGLSIKAS